MNAIIRRLRRLENYRFGPEREEGPSPVEVLRERERRWLAAEVREPIEDEPPESLIDTANRRLSVSQILAERLPRAGGR